MLSTHLALLILAQVNVCHYYYYEFESSDLKMRFIAELDIGAATA